MSLGPMTTGVCTRAPGKNVKKQKCVGNSKSKPFCKKEFARKYIIFSYSKKQYENCKIVHGTENPLILSKLFYYFCKYLIP